MNARGKKFLYLVDDGWKYERRELLDYLGKDLSFDVATHDEQTARELGRDFTVHKLEKFPLKGSPLYTLLMFFARELDTETVRNIQRLRYHQSSLPVRAMMRFRELLGTLGLRRYSYSRALEILYRRSDRYGEILKDYEFLVFSPVMVSDKRIIYEARRRGIRIVCSVFSWDNPMKDNEFMPDADRYLVWNRENRETLGQLYGIPGEIVDIVGPVQFDYLLDRRKPEAAPGPGPGRYILFACSTGIPFHIEQEVELVLLIRRLVDGVDPSVTVVVRPYPYSRDEHAYDVLKDREGIEVASFGTFTDWKIEITRDDLDGKLAQIEGAASIVNVVSTIGLEASFTETPILQVAFTVPGKHEPWQDLAHIFKNDHLGWIIDPDYPNTVRDEEELGRALADVLGGRGGRYLPYREKLQRFANPMDVQSYKEVYLRRLEELLEKFP